MAEKKIDGNLDFKDRKTGLVIFGIVHIIIGTLFALGMLVAFVVMGFIINRGFESSLLNVVLLFCSNSLLAIWFIWMGIGSIKARKWARALILITSWLWFICGVIGLIFNLLFMPDFFGPMATGEEIPREITFGVHSIVTGFMIFILIVIPGAFVLFYGSRHVKATCEQRDPRVRWTDKAPLPVITLSSLLGCNAILMPFAAFSRWTTTFFGFVLSGIPGAVVVLIYAVLFAYAAWGTYKLQIKAWWCGFVLTIASVVSMVMTFSRVSRLEFYEKMGISKEHLKIIQEFGMFQNPIHLVFVGLIIIGFLGFMLYTKRYFKASAP